MPQQSDLPSLRRCLRAGWHVYWQRQVYRITSCDHEKLLVYVENVATSELGTLRIQEILRAFDDMQSSPVFAPTLKKLHEEIEQRHPLPASAPASGLPEKLLQRADKIIKTVEQVRRSVPLLEQSLKDRGNKFTDTDILRLACKHLEDKVGLTTFYDYEKRYGRSQGNRERIAESLRRSTHGKTRLNSATLHFLDTLITRYYRADRPSTPFLVYKIGDSALKSHTDSYWIDPAKCSGHIPEDLVNEMKLVLDEELPVQAVLANPDKAKLLAKIKMPSRGYFYEYMSWFGSQPDLGRKVMNDRYGDGTWEQLYMAFDTFVSKASLPLQFVFADHHLLDVFIVDRETRSKIDRLWVTILIDAYSRSILGMALLYEEPCIESIQSALRHAIWPKTSHTELGLTGEWPCYGIPLQLSLDNAWAHHSHSLESLALDIGRDGMYDTIDLVFRPPYKARYGALIESFFGNLSNEIKQTLPGAIQSSDPKHVRDAAKKACLLYEDIYRFLHEKILAYQHTEHSALKMTPHQKWLEGIQTGLPLVPPLDGEMQRLFWRKSHDTRKQTTKGISVFGMNYISLESKPIETKGRDGQKIEYSYRYEPSDISTIALFRGGHFVCDVSAKELLLPDSSLKPTSLWEVEMAKGIAKGINGDTQDWLAYVNRAEELRKRRLAEKRRIQRKLRVRVDAQALNSDSETNSAGAEVVSTGEYDDYTELLADFQS